MAKANSSKKARHIRRSPARALCRHFENTTLVGCARAGLTVLETQHKSLIVDGPSIGCGVHLDLCRVAQEPEANRWDYIFVRRDNDEGIGVEVHPASRDHVDEMIKKKNWAHGFLETECPNVEVRSWIW